jgi:hypothetical protein
MKNFTIYLAVLLCLFLTKIHAQESFETRVQNIALKIEAVTKEEKAALKKEVEDVNVLLEQGAIQLHKPMHKKKPAQVRLKHRRSCSSIPKNSTKSCTKVDGKTQTPQIKRFAIWNSKR